MPIHTKEVISLEKHIYPILKEHNMKPHWHNTDDGHHNGIYADGGYVAICNTDNLYVEGKQEFADFLLDHCQPYGKELMIKFYP